MTEAPPALRAVIAIPSFKRPELLERLLDGLRELVRPQGAAIDVLVLDNDPERSAWPVVERVRDEFPFRLSYVVVAEPGLSSVRNAALASARGYDVLAMIDDDERPEPAWFAELLRVRDATGADAVVGPVPQEAPPSAPRWLREGNFLELPAYRDCELLSDGWSGNCLLRIVSIESLGLSFDRAFDFAGGEDLLFFRQLRARGGTLAYAREAVAVESAGRERFTVRYVLKHSFRRGNTLSLCDRRLGGGARAYALRALKAYARIVRGSLTLLPYALFGGRRGALRSACDVARGLGAFAGLFGYRYLAYDRPDVAR